MCPQSSSSRTSPTTSRAPISWPSGCRCWRCSTRCARWVLVTRDPDVADASSSDHAARLPGPVVRRAHAPLRRARRERRPLLQQLDAQLRVARLPADAARARQPRRERQAEHGEQQRQGVRPGLRRRRGSRRAAPAGLMEFDLARLVRVGQPQLDLHPEPLIAPSPRRTVLYAPTWEGDADYNDYSSVDVYGRRIVQSVLALPGVRLVYKPHPKVTTSTHPAIHDEHHAILAMVADAAAATPTPATPPSRAATSSRSCPTATRSSPTSPRSASTGCTCTPTSPWCSPTGTRTRTGYVATYRSAAVPTSSTPPTSTAHRPPRSPPDARRAPPRARRHASPLLRRAADRRQHHPLPRGCHRARSTGGTSSSATGTVPTPRARRRPPDLRAVRVRRHVLTDRQGGTELANRQPRSGHASTQGPRRQHRRRRALREGPRPGRQQGEGRPDRQRGGQHVPQAGQQEGRRGRLVRDWTVAQLRKRAAELEITGRSSMKRPS